MNLIYLSIRNILSRPLSSFLSWLLLSFGVTIILLILLVSEQVQSQVSQNTKNIDLVVGSKGSPLQLILSSVFHVDFPTGNISLKQATEVAKSRFVETAIPMSLGDSYKGFRIVGTTKAYMDLYQASLAEGAWSESAMNAVVGADVVRELGISINDQFESQHGLDEAGEAHGGHAFKVTGVLKKSNTVLDKLILVSVPSVWLVHGHEEEHEEGHDHSDEEISLDRLGFSVTQEQLEEEEITALLIKYRSPMAAVMMPRSVNARPDLQSASPAYEAARLFNIIGAGLEVVNLLGLAIMMISGASVFVALLNSLKERRYEIAIMRSMGASRFQIFVLILFEGLIITLVGAVSGLVIAHGSVALFGSIFEAINPEAFYFVDSEWFVLLGCLLIGFFASVIPAVLAYRTDISETLAKA